MIANKLLYLHAAFEVFVGLNFIFSPENLLNGYQQKPGFESLAHETFGISCIFWGMLLFLNNTDRVTIFLNVLWNVVWVVVLGSQLIGMPLRAQSAVEDASFVVVPVVAHAFFALISVMAQMNDERKTKKS